MSPTVVRALAMAVFFGFGIPGMIVSSINDNAGAAVTFGLVTAGAALVLLAVTAVTIGRLHPGQLTTTSKNTEAAAGEAQAEELEGRIQALVDAGADEEGVRSLVRAAVRMARRDN